MKLTPAEVEAINADLEVLKTAQEVFARWVAETQDSDDVDRVPDSDDVDRALTNIWYYSFRAVEYTQCLIFELETLL